MGQGIDLESATAEPYHAMKAGDDPKHAAGGRGRRGCCSAACFPSAESEFFVPVLTAITATGSLLVVLAMFAIITLTYRAPSYSVHLTGYDGIDPGAAARIVSPAFNVTLRMNNTCVDSARVAVTYSGVALGWARAAPLDCAARRWGRDVEVVARGGGVGLSRRLRDRMASDWSSGAVELDVNVMMYREGHVGTEIPRTFAGKVRLTEEAAHRLHGDSARRSNSAAGRPATATVSSVILADASAAQSKTMPQRIVFRSEIDAVLGGNDESRAFST